LEQAVSVVLPALFGAVAVDSERDEATMVSLDDALLAGATARGRQTRGDKATSRSGDPTVTTCQSTATTGRGASD
jgi:hypothetical protein